MIIYRIEEKDKGHGMWYDENGNYKPLKGYEDFPMEHSEEFSANGDNWFCGCESLDQLKSWFTANDICELKKKNYGVFRLKTEDVIVQSNQVLFKKENIEETIELELEDIFGLPI